jgi:hypothetical protein
MSSPKSRPQRSPKRDGSTRTPLQQRSRSQVNISPRLVRDTRQDPVFDAMSPTPYPTKPEHILRPSAVRRQRNKTNGENTISTLFSSKQEENRSSSSLGGYMSDDSDRPRTANAPTLSLKRSVVALRDMYEAQAEKSRPSTAVTSPVLRPTSAASNKLRNMSSSDSLSGGFPWGTLQTPSIDDLAMLPAPLRTASGTVRTVTSDLESRRLQQSQSSSPNITKLGSSSTSMFPLYDDLSNPQDMHMPPSSSTGTFTSSGPSSSLTSSSPNVTRLGRSSSVSEIPEEEESSSPNVVRIATTLPIGKKNSPVEKTDLDSSPRTIRHHKRKRSDAQEMLSFAARSGISNPWTSSPPYSAPVKSGSSTSPDTGIAIQSSPPRISIDSVSQTGSENTSDYHAERPETATSEESNIVQTHRNLQAAMTSSPVPPVQYPIVRAPAAASWTGLSVPKRPPRVATTDPVRWTSRLSTVPSETSARQSKGDSMRSDVSDDDYSLSDVESNIVPTRAYMATHDEGINSRSCMVAASESDHNDAEATDFVSALPSAEYRLSSPPTTSYLGVDTNSSSSRLNSLRNSMDARLNSMRSFRNNSMRNSQRPSSSSSISTFQIPSWARRYYSGIYRDSFQEMYASTTDVSSQARSGSYGRALRPHMGLRSTTSNLTSNSRPSTSISRKASSIAASVKSIVFPRSRPRLNARNSHLEPGIGPLVSNPVRPPTATLRPVSILLDPADPRAHWAGAEADLAAHQQMMQDGLPQKNRMGRGRPSSWSRSPHLHRDDRLLHRQSRWKAPSLDERSEPFFTRRNAQVMCFLLGFVTIIPWFVGSFLRLPSRPESGDLEKRMSSDVEARMRRNVAVVDELRWENAAWWRNLNRAMCIVGIVVIILIIVLSVVGSRNW